MNKYNYLWNLKRLNINNWSQSKVFELEVYLLQVLEYSMMGLPIESVFLLQLLHLISQQLEV